MYRYVEYNLTALKSLRNRCLLTVHFSSLKSHLKPKDPHPNGIAALFLTPAGNLDISSETMVKDTFGTETASGGEIGCPRAMFEFK